MYCLRRARLAIDIFAAGLQPASSISGVVGSALSYLMYCLRRSRLAIDTFAAGLQPAVE
jgi:hypothetical protein